MLCVLMEILLYARAKKKTKGFQMSHIYGSFSSDIMAVKGLTANHNDSNRQFKTTHETRF